MKPTIFLAGCLLAMSQLLVACYADRSKNDYDTSLPDVKILIPQTAYSSALGGTVEIEPYVETDIDEADLSYCWEVRSDSLLQANVRTFRPLLPDSLQGKTLHYIAKLDANVSLLNNAYPIRLRVHQKSTGRDFYSLNECTLTISGITGLMILHGTDEQSDIALLQASEFTPKNMSLPDKPIVFPHLYSTSNGGSLPGAPRSLMQAVTNYIMAYGAYYPVLNERCGNILVMTSQGATWIKKDGFKRLGDWNSVFYLKGNEAVNQGNPKAFFAYQIYLYAFDGNDIFVQSPLQQDAFLFPEVTGETRFTDGNTCTFAPQFLVTGNRTYPAMLYATSVNNDGNKKGFFALRSPAPGYIARYGVLLDTRADATLFNPGDMKASLVYMAHDGRAHLLAVMRGDADHPRFAGRYFAVDLNLAGTAVQGSTTAYSGIPQYMYSLEKLPAIEQVRAFVFGSTAAMCYYATSDGVYQYQLDAGAEPQATLLAMTDGTPWSPQGEITMMQMLDTSENTITREEKEQILMVATYTPSKGAILWSLWLDAMTGRIKKTAEYSSSNIPEFQLQPIKDIYIKAM